MNVRASNQSTFIVRTLKQGNNKPWLFTTFLLLIALVAFVFLPGKSGPFIFDDYSNLIENSYIKIDELNLESLRQAAYSLEAGPLKRPIAMTSFALNYYWAPTFHNSAPYKITNIVIHAINGMVVFWFTWLVLSRLKKTGVKLTPSPTFTTSIAAAAALVWLLQPMHVSTVLYVVQRMTQLSTLFTLLALISYLYARQGLLKKASWAPWLLVLGPLVFGTLGILSKETALLTPIFILLLELILYGNERPWKSWHRLKPQTRGIVIAVAITGVLALLVGAIFYALPNYPLTRRFTMMERVLTETRVLFFYLSLLLVPRIDQFGHQHDDILLSTSLVTPWTTLLAIIGHLFLIALAFRIHKRQPLLALGILWFYVAHLLESTLFNLEIAYEHRNYLAALGVSFILISLLELARTKLRWRYALVLLPVIAISFGGITFLRSTQWADHNYFYRYEVEHHPNSARIQIGYSILLEAQGRYAESMQAIRRSVEIEPDEPGYWLQLHLIAARLGVTLSPDDQQKTLQMLGTAPISATTMLALDHTIGCFQSWCKSLQIPFENWIHAILNRGQKAPYDKAYFHYLLGLTYAAQGRINDALEELRFSYVSDRSYLHPLFVIASIHIQRGERDQAEEAMQELRLANARSRYPRTKDLAILEQQFSKMTAAHPGNER